MLGVLGCQGVSLKLTENATQKLPCPRIPPDSEDVYGSYWYVIGEVCGVDEVVK